MGLGIDVLHSTGSLEDGLVDGHAVSSHDQGVLVDSAVGGVASLDGSGVQLSQVGLVQQVGQVDHQALLAPVGDQTLGTFHDQVGSSIAFDSGVDLVVAVSVGQVLNGDLDAGVSLELGHQSIDGLLVAPTTDGVGPQGDFSSSSGSLGSSFGSSSLGSGSLGFSGLLFGLLNGAGSQGHNHDQSQQKCDKLLHKSHSPHLIFSACPKVRNIASIANIT